MPAQVRALAQDAHHVRLSWSASQDDVAVRRYLVSRNGATYTAVAGDVTTLDDPAVQAGTVYSYDVRAEDTSANVSAAASASVRTQPVVTTNAAPLADTYVSAGVRTPTTARRGR